MAKEEKEEWNVGMMQSRGLRVSCDPVLRYSITPGVSPYLSRVAPLAPRQSRCSRRYPVRVWGRSLQASARSILAGLCMLECWGTALSGDTRGFRETECKVQTGTEHTGEEADRQCRLQTYSADRPWSILLRNCRTVLRTSPKRGGQPLSSLLSVSAASSHSFS